MNSSPAARFCLGLLLCLALTSPGCRKKTTEPESREFSELKMIGMLYMNYCEMNKKAPDRFEDFKKLIDANPGTAQFYERLRDGRFVFIYGVAPEDMPGRGFDTVICYERDAPTQGGLVVTGIGMVKKMTAQEFQSAQKAAPKKK